MMGAEREAREAITVRATAVGRDVEQNAVLAGDSKRKG